MTDLDPRPPAVEPAAVPPASGASDAADLLELVIDSPDVESSLAEVVRRAAELSPAIAGVGVTVRRHGHLFSVATSNALAAAVDEVQYGLDTGPCLDSLRYGEVVPVPDMAAETRWDTYPAHAVARGVRSSLSLPMTISGVPAAALNTYGAEPNLLVGELAEQLGAFARQAQLALVVAMRQAEQRSTVEQLHTAMQTRSLIDQALGILMARNRSTADDAFAALRAASQSSNRKIVDIAAELIEATSGQPPKPGRFER